MVNEEEWSGSPANIKGANRDAKIQVGRSMTTKNLLFCAIPKHELRNQHVSVGAK